jgi:hypothetical protein
MRHERRVRGDNEDIIPAARYDLNVAEASSHGMTWAKVHRSDESQWR